MALGRRRGFTRFCWLNLVLGGGVQDTTGSRSSWLYLLGRGATWDYMVPDMLVLTWDGGLRRPLPSDFNFGTGDYVVHYMMMIYRVRGGLRLPYMMS